MRIELLSLDEAIVTRGLFRKRRAHVTHRGGYFWQFAITRRRVSGWVQWRLDMAVAREIRRKADADARGKEWVDVKALPEARVVERAP